MRLINVHTLKIEEFVANPPRYAILSHRWIGREITYEEYQDHSKCTGPGFQKILDFCKTVREDETLLTVVDRITAVSCSDCGVGAAPPDAPYCPCKERRRRQINWIWVDTCCIDKRSSAELSEVINSMWHWYRCSTLCVVYLEDVFCYEDKPDICGSEWFARGWTLQELLAPPHMLFYDRKWTFIGAKVSKASGIPEEYLTMPFAVTTGSSGPSVAQRMSWASRRKTTRKEDEACCLFGLFGVNLPLLYGEGSRAFWRLQKEIARCSEDDSIFAWQMRNYASPIGPRGLFAPSPKVFESSGNVIALPGTHTHSFKIIDQGIKLDSLLAEPPIENARLRDCCLLLLNCAERVVHLVPRTGRKPDKKMVFNQCLLVLQKTGEDTYQRVHPGGFPLEFVKEFKDALTELSKNGQFVPATIFVPELASVTDGLSDQSQTVAVGGYKILYFQS